MACLWWLAEAAEGGLSLTICRLNYAPPISGQPGLPELGVTILRDISGWCSRELCSAASWALLQVHLLFQFDAVFLTLHRPSQHNYYYLLVTACCWFILRGKRHFVFHTLPCHLRHMLTKDRFGHPFFPVALRPQYRFIINEDETVTLLLFIFITTPKLSCWYLCASQISHHIPRNAQYFMLKWALMYSVLNKDVSTHVLLLTLHDFTYCLLDYAGASPPLAAQTIFFL